MKGVERVFVIWTVVYLAIYMVVFFAVAGVEIATHSNGFFVEYLLPFHVLGMVQNVIAFGLTVRDLYKRDFANPNDKLTWLLLILLTGGVGWLVYVFKHALKPRHVYGEPPHIPRQ